MAARKPATSGYGGGFILVHRRLRESWIWNTREPKYLMWFIDLLMEANYVEKRVLINGQLVICERGQCVRSQSEWEKRWGASRTAVRNFISLLKRDSIITTETTAGTTKITICNYDSYQSDQPEVNTKRKTKRNISLDTVDDTEVGKQHNKVNKEKMKEGEGESPTPVIFSNEQFILINRFKNWVEENAPSVNRMKEPFTDEQIVALFDEFNSEEGRSLIERMLLEMHNWAGLTKKVSANLTLRSWIRREKENQEKAFNQQGKLSTAEMDGRRILESIGGNRSHRAVNSPPLIKL